MQDKVKNETRLSSNINVRVEMQRFGLRQVTCTWEIDMYPIELKWSVRPEARLHFDMFPFGQLKLILAVNCQLDAACRSVASGTLSLSSLQPTNGSSGSSLQPTNGSSGSNGTVSRRRLFAARAPLRALALNTNDRSYGDASGQYPLVASRRYTTAKETRYPSFEIEVTMERKMYMVFLYRLMLPIVLVLTTSLLFFFIREAITQLELAFTSLLVIILLGIEVKSMVPSWVSSPTWLDGFVVVNNLLMVFICAVSLGIVALEEIGEAYYTSVALALDSSVKHVMPVGCLAMNTSFFLVGLLGETDQWKPFAWTFFACLLGVFFLYTSFLRRRHWEEAVRKVARQPSFNHGRRGSATSMVRHVSSRFLSKSPPQVGPRSVGAEQADHVLSRVSPSSEMAASAIIEMAAGEGTTIERSKSSREGEALLVQDALEAPLR